MSPRFLIHPGYPKTGTTSLQAHVFAGHPQLHYLSNHSAPGDAFRDAPETQEFHALMRDLRPEDLPRIDTLWQNHMRPAADETRLNVISDETFLTNEGPSAEIARKLHDLVGAAQVLLVVREQADVLRSIYDMYPWLKGDKKRRFLPFPEWLRLTLEQADGNVAGALHYREIVTLYREVFGADAVMAISYDRLFRDETARARLCAWLGIDTDAFSALLVQNAVNTSADHATKKLVRRVLGPVQGSSFLTPGQIRMIRGILTRLVPQKKTTVTEADQARIAAFYQGQRIADLQALGTKGVIL